MLDSANHTHSCYRVVVQFLTYGALSPHWVQLDLHIMVPPSHSGGTLSAQVYAPDHNTEETALLIWQSISTQTISATLSLSKSMTL